MKWQQLIWIYVEITRDRKNILVSINSRAIEVPQLSEFLKVNCYLKVHNAHFKNGTPFLDNNLAFIKKNSYLQIDYISLTEIIWSTVGKPLKNHNRMNKSTFYYQLMTCPMSKMPFWKSYYLAYSFSKCNKMDFVE